MSNSRDNQGKFKSTKDKRKDAQLRSSEVKSMHGFGNLKSTQDYAQDVLEVTEQAMSRQGTKRSQRAFNQMEASLSRLFNTDYADIYAPSQNFFTETPGAGDDFSDEGRVPLYDLVFMSQYRVGFGFRATYGEANAVYKNGYEFIKMDDEGDAGAKPVKQPEIKQFFDATDFYTFRVNHLFRAKQTGLGIGIPIWKGEKQSDMMEKIDLSKLKDRPYRLKAYSAFHLSPANMLTYELGDYDKSLWDWRGGVQTTLFNHNRCSLLEPNPEPFHLRGLATLEPAWTPSLMYFNIMIFAMKSMAQVGTMTVGIKSANEFPSRQEIEKGLEMLDLMRANKFYYLGAGAELVTQNMSAEFGRGMGEILEFLKEDISARLRIPKNQLWGRSEGGGLEGAGALVSKDDWLSSLMEQASDMTSEELSFLRGPCKFDKHLEGLTIRWRLDLHKTEMERLQEESVRMDMEMKRIMKVQAEKQLKMNDMLLDAQMSRIKKDPEGYLDEMNQANQPGQLGDGKQPQKGQQTKTPQTPRANVKQKARVRDFQEDLLQLDLKPVQYNYGLNLPWKPRRVDEGLD